MLQRLLGELARRLQRPPIDEFQQARSTGTGLSIEHLEPRLALSGSPLITEFMASNDATIADGNGNYPDWIEIYNPSSLPIDLAGWHLTDNPSNLDKWTFPAEPQSIIDPGELLVVFASSQPTETYIDPAGYLHTDFALRADGEYVALTNSNEEIVHEYAPTFPAQLADVSYGLIQNTTGTPLVDASTTAQVLVPTDASLDGPDPNTPPAWTLPGFDASIWSTTNGGPAVGFDTGTDEVVDVPDGTLLPGGLIGFDLTDPEEDGTPNGTFTAGGSSPNGETPDRLLDNTTGTKWLSFEPTGTYYQFRFANGARHAVNAYTLTSANDSSNRDPYSWVLLGSNNGTTWTTVDSRAQQDFSSRFETRLYEFANNTAYEEYRFELQTQWGAGDRRGSEPNSIQIAELELLSTGPVDYNPLLNIDLAAAWDTSPTSVYQRIEFDVDNPSSFASLQLDMQYDDGFVAYLNGTRVASAYAPESPKWQSHALDARQDADALAPETFNLTGYIDQLVAGTNVLSIHVLNSSDDDPDLLSIPTLTAIELIDDTVTIGFMPQPTPGAANSSTGVSQGPTISNVTENPPRPTSNQDLVISAEVSAAGAPVDSVTMHYRVMYGAEVSVTMLDDGLGSDAIAGDGVYTAQIPSSAYGTGQMVRWYVTATDTLDDASRYPLFLAPTNSPEYLGTVTVQPGVSATLPVFEYFVENVSASGTQSGTRASVYFLGEFYDNVFIRHRGGNTTQGRKFEFNDGHHFLFDPAYGRVDEINLNERGGDPTYMRQILSWDVFAAAGLPASIGRAWYTRINDSYLDVRVFIEQPDSDLLIRTGLDEEGAFYKIGRDGVENSVTSSTQGVGERTRRDEDNSDLQALVDGVNPENPDRAQYVFDNVDIASTINYLAATSLIHNNDHPHKNYHLYRDTEGSGQWMFIPWDMDLTFGLNFGISGIVGDVDPFGHPFFGDSDHRKIDGHWNRLIDAVFEVDSIREMYVRRLRTLMDALLLPPGAAETPWIEQRINELNAALAPHVGSTSWQNHVDRIVDEYLVERRQHLYVNHSITNPSYPDNAGIPAAQAGNPPILFGTIDYNPVSGNQDEEFIELVNPNSAAVDISGWRVSGAIEYQFRAGTVIPAGGSLYVAADVPSFLARSTGPAGGQFLFVQGNYSGRISSQGESFELIAADGALVSTATTPADDAGAQAHIRISELNYHPYDITPAEQAALPLATEDDFDFIELVNTHPTDDINLQGLQLSDGLSYTFGSVSLSPGERIVVVEDIAAFTVRYGTGVSVTGQWSGALSNSGETIELITASGATVMSVTYSDQDPWPTAADGDGPTLQIIDALGFPNDAANWQASSQFGGSPGTADGESPLPGDYDRSGVVDQLDYAVWRSSFGMTVAVPSAGADGNGDGRVDIADYAVWRDNLGATAAGIVSAGGALNLASSEPQVEDLHDASDPPAAAMFISPTRSDSPTVLSFQSRFDHSTSGSAEGLRARDRALAGFDVSSKHADDESIAVWLDERIESGHDGKSVDDTLSDWPDSRATARVAGKQ